MAYDNWACVTIYCTVLGNAAELLFNVNYHDDHVNGHTTQALLVLICGVFIYDCLHFTAMCASMVYAVYFTVNIFCDVS